MNFRWVWLLSVSALLLTGCSAFRAAFDESPEETAEKSAVRSRTRSSDQIEDPLEDFFKPKRSARAPLTVTSSLSPEERALVESETGIGTREREETQSVRDRMRRNSETSDDWVFGGNPFKSK